MARHPLPPRRRPFLRALSFPLVLILFTPWSSRQVVAGPETGAEAVSPSAPAASATATATADVEVVESTGSFESQGKTITIERYEPRAPGTYPAVLVVHGAGGMTIGGPWFRDSARLLARRGYVAHVVHYFDLTGTRVADLPAMKAHFPAWMKVLADGISNLSRQPNVDPGRVGMLGFSLGSYLSLSLSMFDTRVLAVVEYFGGLPDVLIKEVKSLPPTLILHGNTDLVVPVSEAKVLESLCKDKNVPYEMCIYPGQGHGFVGDPNVDASRRTVAFFETHVKKASPAPRKREKAVLPNLDLFAGAGEKTGGGK